MANSIRPRKKYCLIGGGPAVRVKSILYPSYCLEYNPFRKVWWAETGEGATVFCLPTVSICLNLSGQDMRLTSSRQ